MSMGQSMSTSAKVGDGHDGGWGLSAPAGAAFPNDMSGLAKCSPTSSSNNGSAGWG